MRKAWLFAGVASVAVASVLWAKQGVVHLKDGTQISGDINDTDPTKIIVTLHGVKATYTRDDVDSIEYPGTPDDQFQSKMTKLDSGDVAGRVEVAKWAAGIRRFDLARRAVAEALAIDPTDPQAQDEMKTIGYEESLSTGPAASDVAAVRPTTVPVAVTPAAPVGNPELDKIYLTLDQVNEIRQKELKPDDNLPVLLANDVVKRYLAAATDTDAKTFTAQKKIDQGREILAKGDPAMAKDVRITGDPAPLVEFHARIHPMILAGCAVSGCHGVPSSAAARATPAGGFGYYTGDDTLRAWYTNFYNLQTYATDPKAPGGQQYMINRPDPDHSLLAQLGLPAAQAELPHPKVAGLRSLFTSKNDPKYVELIKWISMTLRPDGGVYPDIQFKSSWWTGSATAVTANPNPVAAPKPKPAAAPQPTAPPTSGRRRNG